MRRLLLWAVTACLLFATPTFAADAPEPTYTNSIGMEFVLIPAGTFQMGATVEELAAVCGRGASWGNEQFCRELRAHEQPRVEARIEQPFYLGKYEVSRAQWREVMGDDASEFEGDDLPAHGVSWSGAREFIGKLNAREGHNRYRLPTEVEWEYAARAGSTTRYFFGDDADELGRYAWFRDDEARLREIAKDGTHPVGQKEPNPWGLFDMYGNVQEWVHDVYRTGDYRESPTRNPRGFPHPCCTRISRGGHYVSHPDRCRSAARISYNQMCRFIDMSGRFAQGFRLAMDVE